MKLFYRVWSDLTNNAIIPNSDPFEAGLEVPRELLINRVIVACETDSNQAFSINLFSIAGSEDRPVFRLIPPTNATGVVAIYNALAPCVLQPNQSQIWLRISGGGITNKKFGVSIAGQVGTPD